MFGSHTIICEKHLHVWKQMHFWELKITFPSMELSKQTGKAIKASKLDALGFSVLLVGSQIRFPHVPKKKNTRLLALSFGLSLAAGLVYCGQHNGGAEIPKEDNNSHIEIFFTFDWITLLSLDVSFNLMFHCLYLWYRSTSHFDSLHFKFCYQFGHLAVFITQNNRQILKKSQPGRGFMEWH